MPSRGAIVLVACGACALALGAVLLRADTARSPASAPSSGSAAAFRSAGRDRDGEAETASSDAAQAIAPELFSPGACLAFPPTQGNRHETVFLDAGHGGIDPGGVGSTEAGASVKESTVNLAIELDTMAGLRAQGYRVVASRTQNTSVTRLTPGDVDGAVLTGRGAFNDVAARDVCANLAKANVLVGVYLGSALTAAAVAYGHLLLLGPAKAGYFDTPSQMPGALIEPLFVTDPFEASIAASVHGQQVIAKALAEAIEQYLT
jgi:N-acetylmuramoyl-L-alanine amidase